MLCLSFLNENYFFPFEKEKNKTKDVLLCLSFLKEIFFPLLKKKQNQFM